MISVFDLEERVFEYLEKMFDGDQTQFGFGSAASSCFFVDRQTNAPRLAASTLMYYRVNAPEKVGNVFSDRPYINPTTGIESVDIHRRVRVTLNVLSTMKGRAKDALSYLEMANQSTRHYEAAYNTGNFNFPMYDFGKPINLSLIETGTWVERIENDVFFNYTDTISFTSPHSLITAPSSIAATKDKIDVAINMKDRG
jgi:hypothetical protein